MRRFRSLSDIRRELADIINQLKADKLSESKAKALGYLLNIMRGVMESSEIEDKLSNLERIINEKFPTP